MVIAKASQTYIQRYVGKVDFSNVSMYMGFFVFRKKGKDSLSWEE